MSCLLHHEYSRGTNEVCIFRCATELISCTHCYNTRVSWNNIKLLYYTNIMKKYKILQNCHNNTYVIENMWVYFKTSKWERLPMTYVVLTKFFISLLSLQCFPFKILLWSNRWNLRHDDMHNSSSNLHTIWNNHCIHSCNPVRNPNSV